MPSINETVIGLLDKGDALSKLGGLIGVDIDETQTGLKAAVPVLVGGIADKAAKPGGSNAVERMLEAEGDSVLDDLGGFLSENKPETGNRILDSIFGAERSDMVANLATSTGLKRDAVGKLLPIVAPMVIGVLSRRIQEGRLDASAVESLLENEKEEMSKSGLLPAGIASATGATAATGVLAGDVTVPKTKDLKAAAAAKEAFADSKADAKTKIGTDAEAVSGSEAVEGVEDVDDADKLKSGAKTLKTGAKGAAAGTILEADSAAEAAKAATAKTKEVKGAIKTVAGAGVVAGGAAGTAGESDRKKRGFGWIIPLLLGALIFAVIAWWLTKGNDDQAEVTTPGDQSEISAEPTAVETTLDSTETSPTTELAEETVDVASLQAAVDKALGAASITEVTGTVDDTGTVTLTGSAVDDAAKSAADAAVTVLPGIISVVNNVEVKPAAGVAGAALECELTGKIVFDSGSASLSPETKALVDEVAACLETQPAVRVEVNGHTDSRGTVEVNKELSTARAEQIRRYLVETKNIDADRLVAQGLAAEQLLEDPDDTPAKQETNRRIEFVVIGN